MSFLQIYKERIYDLLLPPKSDDAGLRLRQDPALSQFYPEGLTEVECADADTVFRSYSAGLQHRNVAATARNTHSSRSHAILSLAVTRSSPVRGKACGVLQEVKSVLTFVDLAGSERACADASRMQEAANINQSLFVLRKVVACLTGERAGDFGRAQQSGTRKRRPVPGSWSLSASTGQLCQAQTSREARHEPESPATQHRRMIGEGEHVPFRESKLTSLLQHAFGGNSFLLMIACLSPLDQNFDENLSTLKYAAQTMNIRNEPVVNLEPKDQLIQELQRENAALKARAARLS
jgi:kinesin family protein 1